MTKLIKHSAPPTLLFMEHEFINKMSSVLSSLSLGFFQINIKKKKKKSLWNQSQIMELSQTTLNDSLPTQGEIKTVGNGSTSPP